jgi:hypothetical protein
MYDLISVPNVGTEELKGFAASGQGDARRVLGPDLPLRRKMGGGWDDALKWMVRR